MARTPRLLILDHRGKYLGELLARVESIGAAFDLLEPEEALRRGREYPRQFDGVIASGGHLKSEGLREVLAWYGSLLGGLERPFLGICLGMKIMGYCHGARLRRRQSLIGTTTVNFHKEFPLAPSLRTVRVHQNHRYELVPPLPRSLESYASGESPVEAVAARGRQQYAVQFHPEVGSSPAGLIIDAFVGRCAAVVRP